MGGTGTSSAPYLIKSSADWKELATQVASGNSYIGKYFMMSDDLNTDGVQVGSKITAAWSSRTERRLSTNN